MLYGIAIESEYGTDFMIVSAEDEKDACDFASAHVGDDVEVTVEVMSAEDLINEQYGGVVVLGTL